MQSFNHDDGRKKREKRTFNVRSRFAKEKLMKKSFMEYRELRYVLDRIQSNLETIIEKRKYTLEQIDTLAFDFAKIIVHVLKMNASNLHMSYFGTLNKSDLNILNSHIKLFIGQESYYSFGAIIEETSKGEGIKAQIGDIFVSEPELREILNKSMKRTIFENNNSVFKGIFAHEEKVKELSHIFTMQMSYAYGYIISKDMKNYIKTDPMAVYEKLSGEEIEVLKELYHLVSATYPSEHDFEPLDLFPVEVERKFVKPNLYLFLETKDWKDKVDWAYAKMERIISEKRIMTLDEKNAFDKVVDTLANEISIPQTGDNLESTREKAKLEIMNPLFKAYLYYLNGQMDDFAKLVEIAKNGLVKVMYKIDYDKSFKKKKTE